MGAHAQNKSNYQWNKERVKAACDGLKYPPNGKSKATDSPLYGAANPVGTCTLVINTSSWADTGVLQCIDVGEPWV
ncbi:hypothetical protein DPV78_006282 [Talaromyces pinophilus]|nr:hypothetical protein DPV78_006282 [Talaromyces pinophilus]